MADALKIAEEALWGEFDAWWSDFMDDALARGDRSLHAGDVFNGWKAGRLAALASSQQAEDAVDARRYRRWRKAFIACEPVVMLQIMASASKPEHIDSCIDAIIKADAAIDAERAGKGE